MFMNRLFGRPKQEANTTLQTLDKLNETLEMLEKKETVLLKKALGEVEKAKEFSRVKNKRGLAARDINSTKDKTSLLVKEEIRAISACGEIQDCNKKCFDQNFPKGGLCLDPTTTSTNNNDPPSFMCLCKV